ncbi:MAG: bifunctional 5,10-methylenetetrahydrofolate dehydrogenase/5,10-methenyltetrahydrofolate cyclohydrolase [Parcubacteria group bacterium]
MKLLRGKRIAGKILADLKKAIKKENNRPGLAVILIGENKASGVYVGLKKKAAKEIGINFSLHKFKEFEKEAVIIGKIKELNENKKIHGIIVQLPLPKNFSTQKIINTISLAKDADGFSAQGGPAEGWHPKVDKLCSKNYTKTLPVFPHAIILLIESSKQKLQGKRAIVIANSKKFGETMTAALKREKIRGEYILYKNYKKCLPAIGRADILISAVGKPGFLKGDMVKKGVIIIDGGITKIGKKVLGDVDLKSVKNKVSYISPVPGGVGPVTIACLLENVYLLAPKK